MTIEKLNEMVALIKKVSKAEHAEYEGIKFCGRSDCGNTPYYQLSCGIEKLAALCGVTTLYTDIHNPHDDGEQYIEHGFDYDGVRFCQVDRIKEARRDAE